MIRSGVRGALVASLIVLLGASGCATNSDVSAARAESAEALRVAKEADAKASAAAADAAAARTAADAAAAKAQEASEKADRIFQRTLRK